MGAVRRSLEYRVGKHKALSVDAHDARGIGECENKNRRFYRSEAADGTDPPGLDLRRGNNLRLLDAHGKTPSKAIGGEGGGWPGGGPLAAVVHRRF